MMVEDKIKTNKRTAILQSNFLNTSSKRRNASSHYRAYFLFRSIQIRERLPGRDLRKSFHVFLKKQTPWNDSLHFCAPEKSTSLFLLNEVKPSTDRKAFSRQSDAGLRSRTSQYTIKKISFSQSSSCQNLKVSYASLDQERIFNNISLFWAKANVQNGQISVQR